MPMNLKYIDIHDHINFSDYDKDREQVIEHAKDLGVGIVVVGIDIISSKEVVALAENHENIWAIVGQHPTDILDTKFQYEDFLALAKHPKVVAIGECGLDYFHSKPEDIGSQRDMFEAHIKLANEVGKPLMLHVRNGRSVGLASSRLKLHSSSDRSSLKSDKDSNSAGGSALYKDYNPLGIPNSSKEIEVANPTNAYQDSLEILKKHAKTPFNFHFFAGSLQDTKDIIEAGGTMSFTGVITFTRNYDEIIRYIPLEKMMVETDCPYVAPVPYRGKRSEPIHVIEVVRKIAEIKGLSEGEVRQQILDNSLIFLNI